MIPPSEAVRADLTRQDHVWHFLFHFKVLLCPPLVPCSPPHVDHLCLDVRPALDCSHLCSLFPPGWNSPCLPCFLWIHCVWFLFISRQVRSCATPRLVILALITVFDFPWKPASGSSLTLPASPSAMTDHSKSDMRSLANIWRSEPKISTLIVQCVSAFKQLAGADEHRHGSMKQSHAHTCARTHSQLQWFVVAQCGKVGASTSTWINTCAQSITGDPETADSLISYYG